MKANPRETKGVLGENPMSGFYGVGANVHNIKTAHTVTAKTSDNGNNVPNLFSIIRRNSHGKRDY